MVHSQRNKHTFSFYSNTLCAVTLGALALIIPVGYIASRTPSDPVLPQRIRMDRNAITARVYGRITPSFQSERYRVNARKGQRMIVHTASLTNAFATLAVVTSPSGAQEGEKGPISFDTTLRETGDYTIRVSPNMMASNRHGGRFLLEVIIF